MRLSISKIAIGVALACGVGLLYFARPGMLPPCPLWKLTGLYCPGCGSTRMLHLLLRGEVAGAFRQNPLAFVLLPFVAIELVREYRFGARPLWAVRPGLLAGLFVIYGILRNLPFEPFVYLAPALNGV